MSNARSLPACCSAVSVNTRVPLVVFNAYKDYAYSPSPAPSLWQHCCHLPLAVAREPAKKREQQKRSAVVFFSRVVDVVAAADAKRLQLRRCQSCAPHGHRLGPVVPAVQHRSSNNNNTSRLRAAAAAAVAAEVRPQRRPRHHRHERVHGARTTVAPRARLGLAHLPRRSASEARGDLARIGQVGRSDATATTTTTASPSAGEGAGAGARRRPAAAGRDDGEGSRGTGCGGRAGHADERRGTKRTQSPPTATNDTCEQNRGPHSAHITESLWSRRNRCT